MSTCKVRILVAEDDEQINRAVAQHLDGSGFFCLRAFSARQAAELFASCAFDLVVCGLSPADSQTQALLSVARKRRVPAIVLMGSSDASSQEGCDHVDVDLDALTSSIRNLLKDASQPKALRSDPSARVGNWKLDPHARALLVAGTPVPLTKIEFNIVDILMSNPGRIFTRAELYEHAWGEAYADGGNTLNAHLSRLRTKLRSTETNVRIQTVWGTGLKLVVDD